MMSPHFLPLCRKLREMGYQIKIATNGTHPEIIRQVLDDGLCDYIALDYKAPGSHYGIVTGKPALFDPFHKTLSMLIESDMRFEVRTTVHSELVDERHVTNIMEDLRNQGYKGTYYLQHYFDAPETLGCMRKPVRKFDPSRLPDIIPVELRNF